MITLTREEAQQVLDALINAKGYIFHNVLNDKGNRYDTAIEFLRARLSAFEPEPLEYWNAVEGWVNLDEVRQHFDSVSCGTIYKKPGEGRQPLYTAPPQREWQGLTDEEILEEYRQSYGDDGDLTDVYFARAIEAKLKEKNT
jgi:hypothetical protein